jgi:hypothetical protein
MAPLPAAGMLMLSPIRDPRASMEKIDLAKEFKPLYAPRCGAFVEVDVPDLNFLMIDGSGDPNTAPAYKDALEALYAVAYAAKFQMKLSPAKIDFRVMPLEGLWWADDMEDFSAARKASWQWTMMIALPDFVTDGVFEVARAKVAGKKDLPALPRLRLKRFREGRAVQTLYLGPYADEGPVIAGLHRFIADGGHRRAGKHHEIYLSDPRRTAPAKLKTIIRQPFA